MQADGLLLIDGVYYVSDRAAAQLFNVSLQTLYNWRNRANPPPHNSEHNAYPLEGIGEWIRKEQIYRKGKGSSYPYKPDMTRFGEPKQAFSLPGVPTPILTPIESPKGRKDRLAGDKLEMELLERAGTLIEVDKVTMAVASMVSRVKTRFLEIPTKLAPILVGKKKTVEIQEILDEQVQEILEELSTNDIGLNEE